MPTRQCPLCPNPACRDYACIPTYYGKAARPLGAVPRPVRRPRLLVERTIYRKTRLRTGMSV